MRFIWSLVAGLILPVVLCEAWPPPPDAAPFRYRLDGFFGTFERRRDGPQSVGFASLRSDTDEDISERLILTEAQPFEPILSEIDKARWRSLFSDIEDKSPADAKRHLPKSENIPSVEITASPDDSHPSSQKTTESQYVDQEGKPILTSTKVRTTSTATSTRTVISTTEAMFKTITPLTAFVLVTQRLSTFAATTPTADSLTQTTSFISENADPKQSDKQPIAIGPRPSPVYRARLIVNGYKMIMQGHFQDTQVVDSYNLRVLWAEPLEWNDNDENASKRRYELYCLLERAGSSEQKYLTNRVISAEFTGYNEKYQFPPGLDATLQCKVRAKNSLGVVNAFALSERISIADIPIHFPGAEDFDLRGLTNEEVLHVLEKIQKEVGRQDAQGEGPTIDETASNAGAPKA